jgi:hypothetical protein
MSTKTFKIVGADMSDGYHTFDELYAHRHALFLALIKASGWPAFWRPDFEGWVVVYLETPAGQISYHIPSCFLPEVETIAKRIETKMWDGHTSEDVITRLKKTLEAPKRDPKYQCQAIRDGKPCGRDPYGMHLRVGWICAECLVARGPVIATEDEEEPPAPGLELGFLIDAKALSLSKSPEKMLMDEMLASGYPEAFFAEIQKQGLPLTGRLKVRVTLFPGVNW